MELSDLHPVAVIAGIIGIIIGIYMVKVAGGGGFGVGEATMEIGLIWKILTPVATGVGSWFIVQKMADRG